MNEELKILLKFKKNFFWGGGLGGPGEFGWGVRVDVNKELKFLGKFTQKNGGGGWGGWVGGGSG